MRRVIRAADITPHNLGIVFICKCIHLGDLNVVYKVVSGHVTGVLDDLAGIRVLGGPAREGTTVGRAEELGQTKVSAESQMWLVLFRSGKEVLDKVTFRPVVDG